MKKLIIIFMMIPLFVSSQYISKTTGNDVIVELTLLPLDDEIIIN